MNTNLITPSARKLNLDDKDYNRPNPDSTVFRDWRVDKISPDVQDADEIEEYADYVFGADACTFILGRNKEANIEDPNRWAIPVGNYKPFGPGQSIMIDTIDGKSCIRTISKMDHRVIILRTALTHLPKIGGEVIRILGESSDAINRKKTEKANKEEIKLMGGRWV